MRTLHICLDDVETVHKYMPFLHMCCCRNWKRYVMGAAKSIGSNMEDEVCRRLRWVEFLSYSDPEFSSAAKLVNQRKCSNRFPIYVSS